MLFKKKPTVEDLKQRERQMEADFKQKMAQAKNDDERDKLLDAFMKGSGQFPYQDYRKARLR